LRETSVRTKPVSAELLVFGAALLLTVLASVGVLLVLSGAFLR